MTHPGSRAVGPGLVVQADLDLEVDGTSARVTGSGHRIQVDTDSPVALWAALSGAALPDAVGSVSGPRAVGRLADGLAVLGLEAEINGPDGMLVRLGGSGPSRLGRALTGSRSVEFGHTRALFPIGSAWVRQARVVRPGLSGAAIAVAIVVVAAVIRRRGPTDGPDTQ